MNPNKTPRLRALSFALCLGAASLAGCDASEDTSSDATGWLDDATDFADASDSISPQEFSAGRVTICFELPENAPEADNHESFLKALDATIVFDKPIDQVGAQLFQAYCRESISRVLQVEVDGEHWSVGYGASDHTGGDITPDVSFAPGQPVTLALLRTFSWGAFYTFSARTEDATFLAMTDGRSQLLAPEFMEGLTVEVGEKRGGGDEVDCGKRVGHELIFDAQTRTTLVGGERGSIELESGPAQVMNIAAWDYEDLQCTDTWGPNTWMAWRASAL